MLEDAPTYHKLYSNVYTVIDAKAFQKRIFQELALLQSSALPSGILVKAFEDRMVNLLLQLAYVKFATYRILLYFLCWRIWFQLSSMDLQGHHTKEGCFFLTFSFQMIILKVLQFVIIGIQFRKLVAVLKCRSFFKRRVNFSRSYNTDRINPNLYEEGKVCVSLLGTWSGKGSETWGTHSNLLQVLISIQALILNSEPYYNEAGYEVWMYMIKSMRKFFLMQHCASIYYRDSEEVVHSRRRIPGYTMKWFFWNFRRFAYIICLKLKPWTW